MNQPENLHIINARPVPEFAGAMKEFEENLDEKKLELMLRK